MIFKKYFLSTTIIFILSIGMVHAGNSLQLPELLFFEDSIRIGEPIRMSMVYKHPPHMELVFPDSTFDYYPFEFVKRQYFTTVSDSATSTDSVVYTLMSFELEPSLRLSLPVFIFEGGDTTQLYSDEASVTLTEVLPQVTPQDSLKANTQYAVIKKQVNYPYLLIGLVVLLLLVLIGFIFFRKKILNQISLYRMKLDYNKFIKKYEAARVAYQQQPSTTILEELVSIWKKYLEKLDKQPYTTLTTKEISRLIDYNQLTSSLQNFDRVIYGGFVNIDMTNSINYLFEIAQQKYIAKQKELKNV